MNAKVLKRYQDLAQKASGQIASDSKDISVIIQVGSATCENAAGAPEVWREFERNIEASGRKDIALHRVGCTGRCSREPIVGILRPGQMPVKYQRVNRDTAHEIFTHDVLAGVPVEDVVLGADGERSQRQVILCAARKCLGGREKEQIEARPHLQCRRDERFDEFYRRAPACGSREIAFRPATLGVCRQPAKLSIPPKSFMCHLYFQ